jgi:hypothetical protein
MAWCQQRHLPPSRFLLTNAGHMPTPAETGSAARSIPAAAPPCSRAVSEPRHRTDEREHDSDSPKHGNTEQEPKQKQNESAIRLRRRVSRAR